jgi:hypothetical protein
MLQNDWAYFSSQPHFAYLRDALHEIEGIWIAQLERGKSDGLFRADLDAKLTYRLVRDILWIPVHWQPTAAWNADTVVEGFLRLLFDGIATPRRAGRKK